jgi:formylglycine-generating enzyme required for sulfatase activity
VSFPVSAIKEEIRLGSTGPQSPRPIWPADAPPLAVSPFNADQAKQHQQAWAKYLGVPVEKEVVLGQDRDGKDVKLTMVLIPPGEFLMGTDDKARDELIAEAKAAGDQWGVASIPSEGPAHRVRINRPYWLGRCEVTLGQFRRFVEETSYKTDAERDGIGGYAVVDGNWIQNPAFVWNGTHGYAKTENHPAVFVSWNDSAAFCRWLSKQQGGIEFSLPTEASWEYACRAGTTSLWSSGPRDDLPRQAWFGGNSGQALHAVGELRPNGFGLYDMHGNVWEWCADLYEADYFAHSPLNDPAGTAEGATHVHRGGDWFYDATHARSASRNHAEPTGSRSVSLGFRVSGSFSEKLSRVSSAPPPPAIAQRRTAAQTKAPAQAKDAPKP